MPLDLLKQQCETALNLAHAGRIRGIVFLTVNDDAETVGWAADWVKRVGSQKLGSPAAALELPATESEQRVDAAPAPDRFVQVRYRSANHPSEDRRREWLAFHQRAMDGIGRGSHQSAQPAKSSQSGIFHLTELRQPNGRVRGER